MDDRFSQINKFLKQEMERSKQPASRPNSKKRWPWLFATVALVILIICFSISVNKNISLSQGKTILNEIKKTAGNIKAAVSNNSLNPLPSFSLEEPKNFLLLGIPGPGNDAPDLTDSIVVAMLSPEPLKATLVSIPRDLWVRVPETEIYTKINSLYVLGKNAKDQEYGLSLIQQKAEEIIGQKIDYYFLIDLSVVKYIVDQQGGLNIMVEKDIYDPQFPGPNHSYETFELKAGWRYLDGETTLKYIRTRHTPDGDFDRVKRQQQVIEALKQKILSMNPVWDFPELLKIISELYSKIETNLPLTELTQFWQIAKKISPEDVKNIVIEKENELIVSNPVFIDSEQVSALRPKAGLEDYSGIQKFIEENK